MGRNPETVGRGMSERAKRNHVSVRLEAEILDRIDTLIPRFSTQRREGTRSDVVRSLILAGLERQEGAETTSLPEVEENAR